MEWRAPAFRAGRKSRQKGRQQRQKGPFPLFHIPLPPPLLSHIIRRGKGLCKGKRKSRLSAASALRQLGLKMKQDNKKGHPIGWPLYPEN